MDPRVALGCAFPAALAPAMASIGLKLIVPANLSAAVFALADARSEPATGDDTGADRDARAHRDPGSRRDSRTHRDTGADRCAARHAGSDPGTGAALSQRCVGAVSGVRMRARFLAALGQARIGLRRVPVRAADQLAQREFGFRAGQQGIPRDDGPAVRGAGRR